jgi:hypothetical protein
VNLPDKSFALHLLEVQSIIVTRTTFGLYPHLILRAAELLEVPGL